MSSGAPQARQVSAALFVHALAPLALDAFERLGQVSGVGHWGSTSIKNIVYPLRLAAMLINPDHVASRIAESCGDLRRIRADGLHDLAAVLNDQIQRRGRAVHHDVDH